MKKFISIITVTFLFINIFSTNSLIADDEKQLVEQPIVNVDEEIKETTENEEETIVEEITEQEIPEEESLETTEEVSEENKEESIESELPETTKEESKEAQSVENEEEPSENEALENVEEESENVENDVDSEESSSPYDQQIVSTFFKTTNSSFNISEDCFEIIADGTTEVGDDTLPSYTYDGQEHTPTLKTTEKAKNVQKFNYCLIAYVIYGVDGSKSELLAAKNAGKYIYSATIKCTPYILDTEDLDEQNSIIATYEYSFVINKKTIEPSSIKTSQLIYNGTIQFPEIYAGYNLLKENTDFKVVGDKPQSKNANEFDEQTSQYNPITYTVNIELLNYQFETGVEADSTNYPVTYKIDKRQVTIPTSYVDEYNPNGLHPNITCTNGQNKINLKYKQNNSQTQYDYWFEDMCNSESKKNQNENAGNYSLIVGNYEAKLCFTNEFIGNNKINGSDIDSLDIQYEITKAIISPDFNALYYTGENQIPTFRCIKTIDGKEVNILDGHANVVDDDADGNPDVYNEYGLCREAWSDVYEKYHLYLKMDESLSECYKWDDLHAVEGDESLAKIGYRINKRNVEFAGWDIKGDSETLTGYLGSYKAEFKWVKNKTKDGKEYVSLEYNGFNPFMFVDANGYYPIPKPKYSYKIGENTYYAKDIVRQDCDYDRSLEELTNIKLNVGNYCMFIHLNNENYNADDLCANFDVTPKPVTISWSNTTIPFDSDKLEPNCEIHGLAPIDEIGFKLVKDSDGIRIETDDKLVVDYSYYKFDKQDQPVVVCYAPLNYVPKEEGRYAVEAANIIYKKTGIPTKNYVLTGDNLMTSYIVGDINSEESDNGISVITINHISEEIISNIVLKPLTPNELEQIIATQPKDVRDKLEHAFNEEHKNINIYLETSIIDPNLEQLILPTENAIVIDLKLYACIEGTTDRYPLTETGTYKPDIQITLNQDQAIGLGYNSSKCFYIARYHGERTPDNTQMADPIIAGSGENTTYTFSLRSNKFSDFAIYVGNKPVKVETNDDHIVPVTAA